MLPSVGNPDPSRSTGRHRGGMGDAGTCWVGTPGWKERWMTLTLSDSPEVRSRQVATVEIRTATVGVHTRTRTRVDRPYPGRPGATTATGPSIDIVEEWGLQSFPASDPPTNW